MDHHWAMLLVVLACVLQLESFGQIIVDLDSTQLPTASNSILDHEIEFGTVEGSFAKFYFGWKTFLFAGFDDGTFSFFPVLIGADVFLFVVGVTEGDLRLEILEIKCLEDDKDDVHHLEELVLELIGAAEDMSVILRETADARQAVQFAALFVTINRAELS